MLAALSRRVVAVLLAAAILAGGSLAAAAPKPDAHDRALVATLQAKAKTFRAIASQTGENAKLKTSLDSCPFIKKNPKQAFGALFVLLPALLVEVVDLYKPQLVDLRATLLGLKPDSPLFAQWTAAEAADLALILKFDNHGQKIDLCNTVTVMLDKKSTAADIRRVLGINPLLIGQVFSNKSAAALQKLDPQMDAFFIAAGVSKKDAATLTQ